MSNLYFYPEYDWNGNGTSSNIDGINFQSVPAQPSGSAYTTINEGVTFPNDSNYITFITPKIPAQKLVYQCACSLPSSLSLNVLPSNSGVGQYLIVNFRMSGQLSTSGYVDCRFDSYLNDVKYSTFYAPTQRVVSTTNTNSGSTYSYLNGNGGWQNFQMISVPTPVGLLGSEIHEYYNDITFLGNSGLLQFELGNGASGVSISAVEIILSGVYEMDTQLSPYNTLYIPGPSGLDSITYNKVTKYYPTQDSTDTGFTSISAYPSDISYYGSFYKDINPDYNPIGTNFIFLSGYTFTGAVGTAQYYSLINIPEEDIQRYLNNTSIIISLSGVSNGLDNAHYFEIGWNTDDGYVRKTFSAGSINLITDISGYFNQWKQYREINNNNIIVGLRSLSTYPTLNPYIQLYDMNISLSGSYSDAPTLFISGMPSPMSGDLVLSQIGSIRDSGDISLSCIGSYSLSNLDGNVLSAIKYYPIADDYNNGAFSFHSVGSGQFYTKINSSPSSGTINDSSFILFNESANTKFYYPLKDISSYMYNITPFPGYISSGYYYSLIDDVTTNDNTYLKLISTSPTTKNSVGFGFSYTSLSLPSGENSVISIAVKCSGNIPYNQNFSGSIPTGYTNNGYNLVFYDYSTSEPILSGTISDLYGGATNYISSYDGFTNLIFSGMISNNNFSTITSHSGYIVLNNYYGTGFTSNYSGELNISEIKLQFQSEPVLYSGSLTNPDYYATVFNLSGMTQQPTYVGLNIRYSGNSLYESVDIFALNGSRFKVNSNDYFLINPNDYLLISGYDGTSGSQYHNDVVYSYSLGTPTTGFYNQTFDITNDFDWQNISSSGGCFTVGLYDNSEFNNSGKFAISALEILVSGLLPNELPISIVGSQPINSEVTLLLSGMTKYHENVNLFLGGDKIYDKSSNVKLFLRNQNNPVTTTKSASLYTLNLNSINSGIPLVTVGPDIAPVSGNFGMTLWNKNNLSGLMNIYLSSQIKSGLPLFIRNVPSDSGTIPVYIFCNTSGLRYNSTDLFITGPIASSKNKFLSLSLNYGQYSTEQNKSGICNIVLKSFVSPSGDMNIFLKSVLSGQPNTNMPLFIGSYVNNFSSPTVPMYMEVVNDTTQYGVSGTKLFISNFTNYSGTTFLYLNGPSIVDESGKVNLFLKVEPLKYKNSSKNLVLYNNFGYANSGMNLVLSNVKASGILPLVLGNSQIGGISGTTNLFISQKLNVTDSSGIVSLYVNVAQHSNIPLFISGRTYDSRNLTANLFTISSTDNSIFNTTNLLLKAVNNNEYMNLILYNTTSSLNSITGNINIFLGNNNSEYLTAPLITYNNTQSVNSGMKLLISGTGQNNGFYVGTGSAPLFLAREIDSRDNRTNLYLKTVETLNTGVSLHISGGLIVNDNINLVIPNVIGNPSGNITMHILGF